MVAAPTSAQAEPAVCASQLDEQVAAIVNRPAFRRMRWGILIQTEGTDRELQTLAAQDAEQYFLPASAAKLLTTAAALEQLTPNFRIRTSVYQASASTDGVVLQVVGRGDPGFSDTELTQLAQQIRDRGITRVHQLIGNDSYFRGELNNPTWEWEDIQSGYGAPANSLILNRNRIGLSLVPQNLGEPLRVEWDNPAEGYGWQINNQSQTVEATAPEFSQVGRDLQRRVLHVRGQLRVNGTPDRSAIAVTQPAEYFLERFQQALSNAQIQVNHTQVINMPIQSAWPEIAAVESAPLSTLIQVANQNSDNLYAEALLQSLGATQPVTNDTRTAGIAVLKTTLTRLGIDPDSYQLADGSGLSRRNLVSPQALVQTLQQMRRSPHAAVYRNSLAIAGVSGTLRNSFRDTPLQGRLVAKTGSLTGVATLAGYFDAPYYQPLVFSLLINQGNPESMTSVPGAIDDLLDLLTYLQDC